MFCNYCGASNPNKASFCNECGKAIARPPANESLPPEVAPTVPLSGLHVVATATGTSNQGTLTESARIQFADGLTAEIRRNIGDKPIIGACITAILILVVVAGFSKILALVSALVGAGLVFKFVKEALEKKYLQPIAGYSDEMLVARYNEVKADRRAAGTRAAIWWAVILIIGVILAILWLAARRHQ